MVKLNFEPKVQSMSNCIRYWKIKKLTPFGKIVVVKSILVPILTHLFRSIPSPLDNYLKK